MRKEFADLQSRFTIPLKRPGTLQDLTYVVELGSIDLELGGRIFTILQCQSWFRVEGINLRNTTVHVEEDDMFGPWDMPRQHDAAAALCERSLQSFAAAGAGSQASEHAHQGDGAEAAGAAGEHLPPGYRSSSV